MAVRSRDVVGFLDGREERDGMLFDEGNERKERSVRYEMRETQDCDKSSPSSSKR